MRKDSYYENFIIAFQRGAHMDLSKTKKVTWILFCLLLFAPFFIERNIISRITFPNGTLRQPQDVWGTIHFIYCYIAYGTACLLYYKWQKKLGMRMSVKPANSDVKWLVLVAVTGIFVSRFTSLALGFGFLSPPMPLGEFRNYLSFEPLWTGIVGLFMQYIYYVFEFALAAFIVDCGHKTSIRLGWLQKIPWGGILLALTWRLTHPTIGLFTSSPINFYAAISGFMLALTTGFAYMLPCKKNIKHIYAFIMVMAWYWF